MQRSENSVSRLEQENYLMTDQEVAELANVPVGSVRYWRQMGMLPFVKVGKHPRIWLSVFNKVFQKPDSSLNEQKQDRLSSHFSKYKFVRIDGGNP